jgi:CTP:molybdopterin cytidylyltransferase MocA
MHSPGVCGVILAAGSQVGAQAGVEAAQSKSKAEAVSELILALNTDTDMVLVALGADAQELEPAVWAHAAYIVQLPPSSSDAETLRAMLQEVLNRGRDAALVAALDSQGLTGETVHRMVAAYREADDATWAVVPEAEIRHGHPVLMGRRMIELFLRGQQWSAADEILSANLEHVRSLKAAEPGSAAALPGAPWKAPWD